MERVARLVAHFGSDDRFVKAVNDRFGTRLNRQVSIRWRHGDAIGKAKSTGHEYAELLAKLDVEIFKNGATAEDYNTSPARLQRLVQQWLDEGAASPFGS